MNHCVALKGGLGNQLFQLAFGLWLSNGSLQDIRFNKEYPDKYPALCHGGEALSKLFPHLKPLFSGKSSESDKDSRIFICLDRLPDRFCEDLRFIRSPAYFEGYFQNWRYVEQFVTSLRQEVKKSKYEDAAKQLLARIIDETVPIIGIHFRRGSYKSEHDQKNKGLISSEKVVHAIDRLAHSIRSSKNVQKARILLFSDDEQVPFPLPHVRVRLRSGDEIQDSLVEFCMMRNCDYLVTANSTFSVWAAYLSERAILTMFPDPFFKHTKDVKTGSLLNPQTVTYESGLGLP